MSNISNSQAEDLVRVNFQEAGIEIQEIRIRDFPDESIVLVYVSEGEMKQAIDTANSLDSVLADRGFDGFVTVKASRPSETKQTQERLKNLADDRVSEFSSLLLSRSRTSEIQPSLRYIPDANSNIDAAVSSRHHLIFGRRGSGKTALLAESKARIESAGDLAVWLNAQTYRHDSASRFFLSIGLGVCDVISIESRQRRLTSRLLRMADDVTAACRDLLRAESPSDILVQRLVPIIQQLVKRLTQETDGRLIVFVDDLHYLARAEQPKFLDLIHGCVRDCNAWIKVATIQHLTQWFDASKQLGLQSGHDASHLDLDLSLQDANNTKLFLEKVLGSYANFCGIDKASRVFGKGTLDRLLIASGAVPRDYLMLCSSAIQIGRQRTNAKTVGVQDINKAAGDAKQKKIDELEDDAASTSGDSKLALDALKVVQKFCLDTKNSTFFRVDFADRDKFPNAYMRLQLLMDLRLIHLLEPSLSDERVAGRKSEVFLLDLSQFAGKRLKRKLTVLDLSDGNIVLKQTGTSRAPKIGDTANKKLGILRRGPLLGLETLCGNV